MRIVIAGGGSVGTAIALDLVDRHHDVTLMEHETEVAEKLRGALHGVNVVTADACEYSSLSAVDLRGADVIICLLYTSPSPRDGLLSRMPSSA